MISAWRISKTRYAPTSFDGEGARRYGGRWNSVGTRMSYASESVALATLEVLVGLQDTALLTAYSLVKVQFPETLIEKLDRRTLPLAWNQHPPSEETQMLGDLWVAQGRSVVLQVPSAVVEAEYNYLFNPEHEHFHELIIHKPEPFRLDPRLLT
jgi:RES domain-containing protein